MKVLVFGDSIAQGFYDTKLGGWVNRVGLYYQRRALKSSLSDANEVFNLGISGDMAGGVLGRIKSEIESRRLFEDDDCVVIAVGINESRLNDNHVYQEVYDFQKIYEDIIDTALELTPHVICVGLSAVDESQTDPWPYFSGVNQYKNNRINLFEDTIKQSAELKGVVFVPIHDEFLRLSQDQVMLSDGLHPNDNGHKFIASRVLPDIDSMVRPS